MKHVFTTATEARRYIAAMGRSSIYTSRGRPPLPRCDAPRWLDAVERGTAKGKIAPCTCTARDVIDPACPWVTLRHAEVVELDGAFIVEADKREPSIAGEVVAVDGADVVLSRVPTAALAPADRERSRPTWPVREGDVEYAKRLAEGTVRSVGTR